MRPGLLALLALTTLPAAHAGAQAQTYPPIERYLMPQDAEIALARTAAPPNISDRATIKVLTKSGFTVARQGDNGNVCMVMRGFSAPICFTAPAAQTALPYYEMRTNLALEGKSPEQIAASLKSPYAEGRLPHRDAATFAYMWSAHQHLGSGIGAWHPHVMIFVPDYDNAMLGGNAFGSPLPQVTDDAGTPFTVVVIPVDDKLAVRLPSAQ